MPDLRTKVARLWDHVLHPQRRPHAVRLLIAVLILGAAFIPVERSRIPGLERSIFESINQLPDTFNLTLSALMQLGNFLAVPVLALVAYVFTRRRRIAIDLALSGTAAWLMAKVVKDLVQRGRPGDVLPDLILRGQQESGYGFVSGHAAVAAALATVAAAYLPPRWKVVVTVLAGIVAFARIYVGAHLPLDVVGGAAMGWAIGSLVHFLLLPEVMGEERDEADGAT